MIIMSKISNKPTKTKKSQSMKKIIMVHKVIILQKTIMLLNTIKAHKTMMLQIINRREHRERVRIK
jgi:hypothetical protein